MKHESKPLSKHAQSLLKRLQRGRFYRPYNDRVPKAMKELVEAGLVTLAARPVVIVSAYVPTQGYTPYVEEKFDEPAAS